MQLVEQVGSGIPRMRSLMKEMNLPEPIFGKEGMFTITFIRDKQNVANVANDAASQKDEIFTDRQLVIINQIRKNPSISARELSQMMSLNKRTIERDIKVLIEKGYLKKIGTTREVSWEVLK